MPDPDMATMYLEVAKAVVGKTTELAFEGGRKLVEYVKNRLKREPSGQAALEAAQASPEQNLDLLADALKLIARTDPEFGERLLSEWKTVHHTEIGTVHMDVSGRANTVNQIGNAGTVHISREA
ncbi:MAG: hypothetical protein ACRD0P_31505 [Stackebrandtia sp.]